MTMTKNTNVEIIAEYSVLVDSYLKMECPLKIKNSIDKDFPNLTNNIDDTKKMEIISKKVNK